ncbi:hypothetical protein LTR36_001668 [Oleoguttula mirabilis]|uniref:F-box domain-containing protein n=1 Tax=Oleoguttula mirabilis TaxID=1507867 RepID=A0AAV9JPM0_9PEZI|nr:hypothetical protein LTR36_001668 [Oleoguttula mirabilis]
MAYRQELMAALLALSGETSSVSSARSVSSQRDEVSTQMTDVTTHVESLSIVSQDDDSATLNSEIEAAPKAFAPPELRDKLLQLVLVRADLRLRDLFLLRRVCKVWQRVIEDSRSLQLKSYAFDPRNPTRNTLPSRAALFVDERLLHLLVTKTGYAHYARHGRPDAEWANPDAFWRKLSVFDPAATTASARIGYFQNPHDVEKVVKCANRSGVTLDDVWNAIVRTMRAAARGPGRGQPELDRVEISTDARGTFKWAPGVVEKTGNGNSYYSLAAK